MSSTFKANLNFSILYTRTFFIFSSIKQSLLHIFSCIFSLHIEFPFNESSTFCSPISNWFNLKVTANCIKLAPQPPVSNVNFCISVFQSNSVFLYWQLVVAALQTNSLRVCLQLCKQINYATLCGHISHFHHLVDPAIKLLFSILGAKMVAGRAQAEENLCAAWATNNTSSRRRQCLPPRHRLICIKGGGGRVRGGEARGRQMQRAFVKVINIILAQHSLSHNFQLIFV